MSEQQSQSDFLKAVLLSYKIQTYDFEELRGTNVTLYKFRPMLGLRISRITGIKNELAAALRVPSVRIIAPMYDGCVGIEIPNKQREIVPLSDILESQEYLTSDMTLPLAIGRTVTNEIFMADLAEMPHLLVAGATGQGKSVGLNVMLMSLLHKKTPDELKLVLIDPKKVELSIYSRLGSAYLARPVITEADEAENALSSLCDLMDERYELVSSAGKRNIKEYNALSIVEPLPYIVVVIDEYGDLVMQSGKEMERYICRLAQKARAVGIHLIISTQRPSATIVTGNIKANFPTRIAFRTTTGTDSRVILDQIGAEKLTGCGDMIYYAGAETTRVQCAYASVEEVLASCEKIAECYDDYEPKEMLSAKESPVVLTIPIHPDTEKAALLICKLEEVSEGIINSYCYGYYCNHYIRMYGKEILQNLRDLHICTPEYNQWGQKKTIDRVLIHDPEQIREIISQYR